MQQVEEHVYPQMPGKMLQVAQYAYDGLHGVSVQWLLFSVICGRLMSVPPR
jgi:hypothetical protein